MLFVNNIIPGRFLTWLHINCVFVHKVIVKLEDSRVVCCTLLAKVMRTVLRLDPRRGCCSVNCLSCPGQGVAFLLAVSLVVHAGDSVPHTLPAPQQSPHRPGSLLLRLVDVGDHVSHAAPVGEAAPPTLRLLVLHLRDCLWRGRSELVRLQCGELSRLPVHAHNTPGPGLGRWPRLFLRRLRHLSLCLGPGGVEGSRPEADDGGAAVLDFLRSGPGPAVRLVLVGVGGAERRVSLGAEVGGGRGEVTGSASRAEQSPG